MLALGIEVEVGLELLDCTEGHRLVETGIGRSLIEAIARLEVCLLGHRCLRVARIVVLEVACGIGLLPFVEVGISQQVGALWPFGRPDQRGDDVLHQADDTCVSLLVIAFLSVGIPLTHICRLLHTIVLSTRGEEDEPEASYTKSLDHTYLSRHCTAR